MKKILKSLTVFCIAMLVMSTAAFAVKLNVNGQTKELAAYNIKGNNYFKLRDMALVLNGTNAQFDVSWDEVNKAINLLSEKPYSSQETLDAKTVQNAVARSNNSPIYMDGAKVIAAAYNIEGNNYFKLRDIAALLDVAVTYDASSGLIGIDTSKKYEFPESDGTFEVNPQAVSYLGKGVAKLEAKYGARIPEKNYYGMETGCNFEAGQSAFYTMVNGRYPETLPVHSVELQFSELFCGCPEKVTLDMLKNLFLEWKIIKDDNGTKYFSANLYGGTFSTTILDEDFTCDSMGTFSASAFNTLMTEIVYVGQEHKNTVDIKPRRYYGDYLRQQAEEMGVTEFYSYTYTLEDITGDGKEEMLCRYMGIEEKNDRVYTVRNGKVELLYELDGNTECFAGYVATAGDEYVERIYKTTVNSEYAPEIIQYFALTNNGEKVLLTTIEFTYDLENYTTYLTRDGKKLANDSEEYNSTMHIAMFSGGIMYSNDYRAMINY